MKRATAGWAVVMIALSAIAAAPPARAEYPITRASLEAMAAHFRLFRVLSDDTDGHMRYVFADNGPVIHVYAVGDKGHSTVDWETNMGSPVRALEVVETHDLRELIVVATARGKIFAYNSFTYELEAENLIEEFSSIQAMAVGQLDTDAPKEVVVLGVKQGTDAPLLYVYDGGSHSLEWRTEDTFQASEILFANLDDDPQLEIILNTGTVIDSRFRTIDINVVRDGGFGTQLRLLDISGDGIPEIFGINLDESLRVYDPGARRRLW